MRMKFNPKARPALALCPFYVTDPPAQKGNWRALFGNDHPIHLELGCGKGVFIAKLAAEHPAINYIAVDIKSEMLWHAMNHLEQAYQLQNLPLTNCKIMSHDIERIALMLSPADPIERIYINFCNPWPKPKHWKKRLTHIRQLEQYQTFLVPNGEIWFKTDDDRLFADSLAYFQECGFEQVYLTYDLHNSGFTENITTEHEQMFTAQGIQTKFVIVKRTQASAL